MQKTRKKRKMMGDFIQPNQRQKHSLDFQFSSEVIPRRNNNNKKRKKNEENHATHPSRKKCAKSNRKKGG
jgi:hypothetical protein